MDYTAPTAEAGCSDHPAAAWHHQTASDSDPFADDFLMEPVAESGIIIILLHQYCVVDGQCHPLDRFGSLQTGKVLVGVGASVPIHRIRQHQILDHRRIIPIDLLDDRIIV